MTMRLRCSLVTISIGLVGCAAAPPPSPARASPSASAPRCEPVAPNEKAALVASGARTTEDAIARLFTTNKVEQGWFAPSFLRAVTTAKIDAIIADVKKEGGELIRVEKKGARELVAVLTNGRIPIKASLDADGRIEHLWFSPTEITVPRPLDELANELRALPGKAAFVVLTDGKEVAAHDADVPMAVGSSFKLAILDALREKIADKRAKWTDVVRLERRHKSAPSGSLHEWPDGAPLTIHTLASLMIAKSDNTATDVLLAYVGRDAAEKRAPGNVPFLSTREAFVLKEKTNAPLLARWRAADPAARKQMLGELAAAKLAEDGNSDEPTIDVEWMFTTRALCDLLSRNKDLEATRINPGIAAAKQWDLVAYKGGSEPGVLNFTSWVEKDGKKHCVSTTWNDRTRDVDSGRFASLHGAMLRSLRAR